ncbi:MAG: Clp protease N-terminal domain-containing protein [Micropruina glycogenica]
MDSKQKTGLAIGAAIIGAGAVFGGSYALGSSTGQSQAQPADQSSQESGPGSGRGPGGGGGGMGMNNLAPALAKKLGVDEAKVTEAIQSVMQANRPSGQPTDGGQPGDAPSDGTQASPGARPSDGGFDRSGMDEKLAKAIAEKLGIDEAKVTKALEEVRAEQQASRQASASPSASPSA